MRLTPVLALVAATVFLAACDEKASCTQEEAEKKLTELTTKIQEVGATDPAKLAALGPKAQEIGAQAQAGGDDLSAACKAIDELIAELNK